MKRIILIRHCHAEGQHKDSPLTKNGVNQAHRVALFLEDKRFKIDRIITSPYLRAIETIKPFAEKYHIPIEVDSSLQERVLSDEPIDDWIEVLEQSFIDRDFRLPGGESSNDALQRVQDTLNSILNDDRTSTTVVVTHGNLLAILLKEFQGDIGFTQWKEFTNPDIYLVERQEKKFIVQRIWQDQSASQA